MSDIKLFKLVTNDEIICEIVSHEEDFFVIKNAVSIVYQKVEGGLSSGFSPFMPHSEGEILLNANAIIGSGNLHPEVLANYNTLFSNFVVPPNKIIV